MRNRTRQIADRLTKVSVKTTYHKRKKVIPIILSAIITLAITIGIILTSEGPSTIISLGLIVTVVSMMMSALIIVDSFRRVDETLDLTAAHTDRAYDKAESVVNRANEIISFLTKPYDLSILRNQFLSISIIYIYYADVDRIERYYQAEYGSYVPNILTEESTTQNKKEVAASLGGWVGGKIGSDNAARTTAESTYKGKPLEDKVLEWQSALLRKDRLLLGIEHSISQIESGCLAKKTEDDSHTEQLEVPPTSNSDEEIRRLANSTGLVLMRGLFTIQENSSKSGSIELVYRHPISNQFEDLRVEIRLKLLSDYLDENIRLNFSTSYKKNIDLFVIGQIMLHDRNDEAKTYFINVIPIVIYSATTNATSIQSRFGDAIAIDYYFGAKNKNNQ